jgi:bacillithiol biosynthesis deacetylase BshB1
MKLDILAFAAHPDDVELGASATLMKHIANGKKVGIVDLTQGELGSRGTKETRYDESADSTKIMGIHYRTNLKMRDGFFEISEENKRLIIQEIRRCQPTIVLANALSDRHPDHGRAGQLVAEACFLAGLTKVETEVGGVLQEVFRPKAVYHYIQDYYLKPDFVVDVSDFLERKMEVISAFKTQFFDANSTEPQTPISGPDFLEYIKARMREMGRPVGAEFAEGFQSQRFIGVNDLFDLV